MHKISKEAAKLVGEAVRRREMRDAMTFGLYSIKRRRKVYTVPFIAPSDDAALESIVQQSKVEPSLQGAYLYRVGDFCLADGALKSYKCPKLITKN